MLCTDRKQKNVSMVLRSRNSKWLRFTLRFSCLLKFFYFLKRFEILIDYN